MLIDLFLALIIGIAAQSVAAFLILIALAAILARPDQPFSSGLLKLAMLAVGLSFLSSLFGGSDCDCDL